MVKENIFRHDDSNALFDTPSFRNSYSFISFHRLSLNRFVIILPFRNVRSKDEFATEKGKTDRRKWYCLKTKVSMQNWYRVKWRQRSREMRSCFSWVFPSPALPKTTFDPSSQIPAKLTFQPGRYPVFFFRSSFSASSFKTLSGSGDNFLFEHDKKKFFFYFLYIRREWILRRHN